MRIKPILLSMLAGLAFVGCTSGDDVDPNGEGSGDGSTSYLAVNLVSSDLTRAGDGYEDGSDIENNVTKVRFYFFNSVGGAANVKLKGSSYVNYYDWTPASGDQSDDANGGDDVESNLKATIVINTQSGDKVPQMMAAVINPTGLDEKSKGLTQLRGIAADYAASDLTEKGKFVMFNSVYADKGSVVSAVPITSKNLQKSEDDAKKNPVTIYVERNVAKVKTTIKEGLFTDGKLALKDQQGNDIVIDGQQVYLQLEGWSLTADTDKGRLSKKINPGWDGSWWNGTHRSFWAINDLTAENQYHAYISNSFTDALYTNENAQQADINGAEGQAKNHTKVMLKGTLCKEDGTAFTIVRHLGVYFADSPSETETENFKELKKSILNQLRASGRHYYYPTTIGGKDARSEIDVPDLEIVPVEQLPSENSKNNCYVIAQLTAAAKAKTWYASMDLDDTTTVNPDDINTALANKNIIDWALAWNDGMTYYYYEILHLLSDFTGEKEKGVVRNHIYDTRVTKIAGLGTPVYNPNLTIYPEKPNPNDHFIAAEIKILSWRLVPNDYELDW